MISGLPSTICLNPVFKYFRRVVYEKIHLRSTLPVQVSFEEKEVSTCQLFEDRQRYCVTEMEGLKQRCSTKLRQVSQRAARNHQALQLQVTQLQVQQRSHHLTIILHSYIRTVYWERGGSGSGGRCLAAGRLLFRCRGVPEQDT